MGTLGKILLFVNLLAAIGVAVLAAQDYAQQQELAGTAVQYQVLIDGLPVETQATGEDAIEFPVSTPGGYTVETISKKRLDTIFSGYEGGAEMGGGGAVPSQMKEIDRVEQKVKAQLDAATPAEQLALLTGRLVPDPASGMLVPDPKVPGWLLRMAESYDEREFVRQLSLANNPDDVAASVATARQMLEKRFANVRARPNPAAADEDLAKMTAATEALRKAGDRARQAAQQAATLAPDAPNRAAAEQEVLTARAELAAAYGQFRAALTDLDTVAPRSEPERRRRIAHLLLHLDESAAWQKRVGLVTGLKTYLDAVRAQADRLEDMAVSVMQQKVVDQARFSDEYELLKTLAVQQSLLLARQIATTTDLKAQRAAALQADQNRYGHLTARQAELAAIKAEVADALQRQATVEAALFDLQKQVGQALQRNFELEEKLESTEQKK